MNNTRYYSTQRPLMPGCFPRKREVTTLQNFDARTFCEDIGREAWGYIEYAAPLTEKEAQDYELVPSGKEA